MRRRAAGRVRDVAGRGRRAAGGLWAHRVAVGTVALVVLHLLLSRQIPWPSVVFDEAGYLGNARWLAGDRTWPMPFSPAYASGYPALLAPWFSVTDDPELQLRGALALNAVLLALLFPTLVALGRRLTALPEPIVLAAAAVGALTPAVLGAGVSAIAENLVLPVAALSVLAAWALAAPGAGRALPWAYGPLVGLGFAAHPRFTGVVVASAVLLVVVAIVRWVPWPRAAANLGGLLVVAAAARWASARMVEARWRDVQKPEGELGDSLRLLTSRDGLAELVKTADGQLWYLLAGSLGLWLIGLAVVGALARSGRAVGSEEPPPPVPDAPEALAAEHGRRIAAIHLLASVGAIFATSVAFFARNQFRIDHFTYGRHNDTFAPVLVAAGLAALLAPLGAAAARRRRWWLPLAGGALGITSVVLNATRDPLSFESRFSPFAAPAIARAAEWQPERAFLWPTVAALVGMAVVAALVAVRSRTDRGQPDADGAQIVGADAAAPRLARPRAAALAGAGLVAVAGGWGVWSGLWVVEGTRVFAELNVEDWDAPDDVRRLGVDHLSIDSSAQRARPVLNYPFALPGLQISMYDGLRPDDPPPSPWVLTDADSAAEQAAGSRIVLLDSNFLASTMGLPEGLALWVRPGAEQDRAAAAGHLLPTGFPTALPDAAASAEIELLDAPDGPVAVASGGRVALRVRVRHTGTESPWPDQASWPLPGHVRLVALIEPVDPDGVRGARSGGQLGRWMLPGDEVVVAAELIAIDEVLSPLPPGRYRVELALAQEGEAWSIEGGAEATFELEVTG